MNDIHDILTPNEVDELRPANEPKHLMMTWRLVQTIDALTDALREADGWVPKIAEYYNKLRVPIAVWLEEADDE
jgi:hypothetical protein